LNEAVGYSEMLLGVFCFLVLNLDVQVLEVFYPLGIGFASNIKNVGDARIDEVLGLERRLKRSHKDAAVHFEKRYLLDRD
jgi:hypothetical protein